MINTFENLLARLVQPAPISYDASDPTEASNSHAGCSSPVPAGIDKKCPSPLSKSMVAYMRERASGGGGAPQVAASQLSVVGEETTSDGADCAMVESGMQSPADHSSPSLSIGLAHLLVAFDDSWLEYLDQFVVWKGHDAAALERELTEMAVKLERSMRLKLGRRELESLEVTGNPDLQVNLLIY